MKQTTLNKIKSDMEELKLRIKDYEDYIYNNNSSCYQSKYCSAIKRKSMDLSRLLADLRQGR